MPLSAILSPFVCTFISSKFGRKLTLIIICIPLLISEVIEAITTCTTPLQTHIIVRGMTGFSLGGLTSILTLYIKELLTCAEKTSLDQSQRGFFALGVFISYFAEKCFQNTVIINIIALAIIAAFLILLVCFLPETPPFLIANKKELDGKDILIKLKNSTMVDNHFRILCDQYKNIPFAKTFKNIITKWRKKIAHNLFLIVFKEFSPASIIYLYAKDIFRMIELMNNVITSKLMFKEVSWPTFKCTTCQLLTANTELIMLGFIQVFSTLFILRFYKHIIANNCHRKTARNTIIVVSFVLLIFGLFPTTIYLKIVSADVKMIETFELKKLNHDFKMANGPVLSALSQNIKWTSWIPLLSFGVILSCYNMLSVCFIDIFKGNKRDQAENNWLEEMWMNAGYDSWTWLLWLGFCFVFNVIGQENVWIFFATCSLGYFLCIFIFIIVITVD